METEELVLSNEVFEQLKEKFFNEISKSNNDLTIFEKTLARKYKEDFGMQCTIASRRGFGMNTIGSNDILAASNVNELCYAIVRELWKTKHMSMTSMVKASEADEQEKMYTEKIMDLQEKVEKLKAENERMSKELEYDENDLYNKLWTLCLDFDYDHSHSPINAFSRMLECYLASSKDDPQIIVNTVADANKALQHFENIHEIVKEYN